MCKPGGRGIQPVVALTSADGLPALYRWLAARGLAKWCGACQGYHPMDAFGSWDHRPAAVCRMQHNAAHQRSRERHKTGHGVRGKS